MVEWIDFPDFVEKTQELIDLGLYEEAKSLLDRYSHCFSNEWELYFLYSRYYAEQNKPTEAIPCLHKGLHLDPTNADCLVGLFYAYAMMNRIQKAGRYLLRAEKLHPDHELVLSALIWYYSESNNLTTAISCFERLRNRGTDNPETYRNAGIAYDRAGCYDKAVTCFKMALDLHPGYDEVRELLADLFIATGKPDKAVELYRQAIAQSPHHIRYLSHLTFCLTQNDEPEKAAETAGESINFYPNSPIGHIDLAYVYLNTGELDKAMAAAEKALAISPLDAEAHRIKAIILSDQGKNAEAEKEFKNALSLDNDNSEILRDYYNHFRMTGDYKRMEEIVSKVIVLNDPSCVEDYWFLADYYRGKKEYLKAFHYVRKAFRIRPGEFDFLSLVADILIARGHTLFSLRFLKRYTEFAGWNETMDRIASYPALRNCQLQESLRFLRFCGSRPLDYYRHIFPRYFKQMIYLAVCGVLMATAFPVSMIFGTIGLAVIVTITLSAVGVGCLINFLKKRKWQVSFAQ